MYLIITIVLLTLVAVTIVEGMRLKGHGKRIAKVQKELKELKAKK